MLEALLIAASVLLLVNGGLLVALLLRPAAVDFAPLVARFDAAERLIERSERAQREEAALAREALARDREQQARSWRELREETAAAARQLREETAGALKAFNDSVLAGMTGAATVQKGQLDSLTAQVTRLIEANDRRFDALRIAVEQKLQQIQDDSARKLEEMRRTVDEKLHATLEARLGASFALVSERLELVHKGLGEMQTLAAGVGDLKKVLTNVKTRGTWGEYQLEALLEQILSPGQYARNVATRGGRERVEFAIQLPGRDAQGASPVWLPIDAKFPKEDYERLVDASERGDAAGVAEAAQRLEQRVLASARDIREKYIDPPATTDFAILYLPVEGLYAEVLRRPGLVDQLQREQRVTVAGPTTLAALLNSLSMGFRTLAVERRSSEVWVLLGAVKSEFAKFGEALEKVRRKLAEAAGGIDSVGVRTRAIERRLRGIETLPGGQALPAPEESLFEAAEEPPT